ncbi:hypothetical protein GSI_09392 [Ganoderma sinense ZZ0214-1]|uniref:Uncharacterized protein n=1 Tax=Ganoderma sinense ZZ0214-1 TaxID=1077348 RepID=A0A2G8S6F2_9APHY|nr:hypothetical protein GSI_09392 [Ganoderma sinense ZZ0214-1]
MSTTISDFSAALDKLDPTGKNWLTFQRRFTIAVRQKDAWSHFDGSTPHPAPADPAKPTKDENAAIATWEKTENLALYLLSQKLPDVTFTKHHRKGTTAAIWAAIVKEFTDKSILLRANLRTSFLNLRYKSGVDLHSEFDRVRVAYEELLNADVDISDAEYASLIINFVPSELSTFISQLSATAKLTARMQALSTAQSPAAVSSGSSSTVLSSEKPVLDAETLMELALEEWLRRQEDKGKGKAKDTGVAASVLSSEKPKKGKGKGKGKEK